MLGPWVTYSAQKRPRTIALALVLISAVSLTVLCILCCRRPRRKSLCLATAALPAAALRTTQDAQGIIHPDVAFRVLGEASGAAAPHSERLKPAESSSRVITPLRPLSPAYQPTQPVSVRSTPCHRGALELTLPPGYIAQREAKLASS
ncbi:hypothetical protein HPB48_006739 [Haemaphysalis longicornis]|uniref:Uncharacterized protein n=1 Tax=Haemaphysalis longicornis TaxID=44386 RepID=A0A9J6G5X3_HAELO|nr:hypothetical protein HPB48_006739 [Haemaphysalis longicornis]